MNIDAWITIAVIAAMLAAMVREWVSPVAAMTGGLLTIFLAGVLTPEQAFAGFSQPATVTIAALFVVARAAQETGAVQSMVHRILGPGGGDRRILARMIGPVMGVSGFLNNTPIVATLAPTLREWSESHDRSPSRVLIPLSYAAILGGLITTIGTSTTLVVSGLISQRGLPPFGLFEVTIVGLPVAILGGAVMILTAPRLLPDRVSPTSSFAANGREYTFRMRVTPFGPLDGKSVGDADLRNLAGVFLARIDRAGQELAPVGPDDVLLGGDVLAFVGQVDHVRDLEQREGLESDEGEHLEVIGDAHRFYEVVVGPRSPLAGRTLKEIGFRGRYDAAVMAIHRSGERVEDKLGRIEIRSGDVLLILADRGFEARWSGQRDFLLIARIGERSRPRNRGHGLLVGGVVLGMVAVAGFGLVPILTAAIGAVVVLAATRVLHLRQAIDAVDLDVILIVAAAFGIGTAVEVSGLATLAADGLVSLGQAGGHIGALAAVMIATLILTEAISNTAAAALMVPIALDVGTATGGDPRGFAVAVAMMASASFLTPIGYQTNTMVYGLGGYRYTDYFRAGFPITLTVFAGTLTLVTVVWG